MGSLPGKQFEDLDRARRGGVPSSPLRILSGISESANSSRLRGRGAQCDGGLANLAKVGIEYDSSGACPVRSWMRSSPPALNAR